MNKEMEAKINKIKKGKSSQTQEYANQGRRVHGSQVKFIQTRKGVHAKFDSR